MKLYNIIYVHVNIMQNTFFNVVYEKVFIMKIVDRTGSS